MRTRLTIDDRHDCNYEGHDSVGSTGLTINWRAKTGPESTQRDFAVAVMQLDRQLQQADHGPMPKGKRYADELATRAEKLECPRGHTLRCQHLTGLAHGS